jgi:dephospho-CoA kinase
MKKIGLTGNIGSGKSVVSEIFSILDIPVYHADEESKKFLADPEVKVTLRKIFGEMIFSRDGNVDRTALAKLVFADSNALESLNSIMHPRVLEDYLKWCESFRGLSYTLHEAAIIYESGIAGLFDKIIHVSCPKETAIERVMKRDGIDGRSVLQRMRFQMEDEKKVKLADFVIINDGVEMIIPQVLSIHRSLSEISPQGND